VDYAFTPALGVQSGLLLTARGAKYDKEEDSRVYIDMYELRLPVFAVYTAPVSNVLKFKLHAGHRLWLVGKTKRVLGRGRLS